MLFKSCCFVFTSTVLFAIGNCSDLIDVRYILDEDLMPSTLLMLENPEKSFKTFIKNDSIDLNMEKESEISKGSFDDAMKTITYHRYDFFTQNTAFTSNYINYQVVKM